MADVKQAPPADPAAANGQAPTPQADECEDCATPSERVMGAVGLLFAVFLAGVAVDLISGGALSRLAASLFAGKG